MPGTSSAIHHAIVRSAREKRDSPSCGGSVASSPRKVTSRPAAQGGRGGSLDHARSERRDPPPPRRQRPREARRPVVRRLGADPPREGPPPAGGGGRLGRLEGRQPAERGAGPAGPAGGQRL